MHAIHHGLYTHNIGSERYSNEAEISNQDIHDDLKFKKTHLVFMAYTQLFQCRSD